ncbi:MAG: hypothetical protein IT349_13400, partial [Candidatus Eisenbacteria bacterium]|nr:hypothetical protein [Candidatus Eisenbacteria bacterium]
SADIDQNTAHGFSDLYLGRIPVRTGSEAFAVFSKLGAYRRGASGPEGRPAASYWRSALFVAGPTNKLAWEPANGIWEADQIASLFAPSLQTGAWTAAHKLFPNVLDLPVLGCECYGNLGSKIATSFQSTSGEFWGGTQGNNGLQLRDALESGSYQLAYHVEHSFRNLLGNPSSIAPQLDVCPNWTQEETKTCNRNLDARFDRISEVSIAQPGQFTNGDTHSYFFLYSSGSYSNMHDMESISEAFVRAPGGGALAYVGKINSSGGTYHPEMKSIINRTWAAQAGATHALPLGMGWALGLDDLYGNGSITSQVNASVLPLLGDPSLAPYLQEPAMLIPAVAPMSITTLGTQSLTVTVRRAGDNAIVAAALVSLEQRDRTYARTLTNAAGVATFRGVQIQDADEPVVVTAASHGYLSGEVTVPVATTQPSVVYRDHSVDDCTATADCDGSLEAGEFAQLTVKLRNDGNGNLPASTATIRCSPALRVDLRINGVQSPTRTYIGKGAATPAGPVGLGFRLPLDAQGVRVEGKPTAVSLSEHFKVWRDEANGLYTVSAYSASQSADTVFTGVVVAQGDISSVTLTGEANDTYSAVGDSLWFQLRGDASEDKVTFRAEAPNWLTLSSPTKALPAMAPSDSATVQFPITGSGSLPDAEPLRFTVSVTTSQVGSTVAFSDFVTVVRSPRCKLAGMLEETDASGCAAVALRLTPVIHNAGTGDADSVVCILHLTGGAMTAIDDRSRTGPVGPHEYISGDPFTLCGSAWTDTVGLEWTIERHTYHRTQQFEAADIGDHAGGGGAAPGNLRADISDGAVMLRWSPIAGATGYWIGWVTSDGIVTVRTQGPEACIAEIRTLGGQPLSPVGASGLLSGYTFRVAGMWGHVIGTSVPVGPVYPWARERAGWPKLLPGAPACAPTIADLSPYFPGAGMAILGASDKIYGWYADGTTLTGTGSPVLYDPGLPVPAPGGARFTEALAFGNWDTGTATPELAGNLNKSGVYLIGLTKAPGGPVTANLKWRKSAVHSNRDPIVATILPNGAAGDGIVALGGTADGAIYVWHGEGQDGPAWGDPTTERFALFPRAPEHDDDDYYNYRALAIGYHTSAAPPAGYDLVAATRSGKLAVYPFTGAGGLVNPRLLLDLEPGQGGFRLSSPAVGDVDGDNDNDIVMTSQWLCGTDCNTGKGKLYMVDAASGALLISPPPSSTGWKFHAGDDGQPPPGPALADLDEDGDMEVVVGTLTWTQGPGQGGPLRYPTDLEVHVFDYESGVVTDYVAVAKMPITQRNIVTSHGGGTEVAAISTPIVGDFDFDGVSKKPDIIVSYSMGAIAAFEYDPGAPAASRLTPKPGWPLLLPDIAGEPSVAKLGGPVSSQYSMAVQCADGWLHVFDLPRKSGTSVPMDWPSYGNTGGNTRAQLVGALARPRTGDLGAEQAIGIESIVPMPSMGRQSIALSGAIGQSVQVDVFDVTGRRLRKLFHGTLSADTRALVWDGRNDRGDRLPAGVYLYRLSWDSGSETRRTVLVR